MEGRAGEATPLSILFKYPPFSSWHATAKVLRVAILQVQGVVIHRLTEANQGQALRSTRSRGGERKGSVRVLCILRYLVFKRMTNNDLNLNSRSVSFRLPAINRRHKVALIRGKEILILLV